jgi:hypothetical protein
LNDTFLSLLTKDLLWMFLIVTKLLLFFANLQQESMIRLISNAFLCSLYFSQLSQAHFQLEQLDFEDAENIAIQAS